MKNKQQIKPLAFMRNFGIVGKKWLYFNFILYI